MQHSDFLSGRRVLVVEDERLIALDIRSILETWGCVVDGPVSTVAAALKLISRDPPDCAVLDVQLARETSEPIAAALDEEGRPFVILTAYKSAHLSGALLQRPLLGKPVDEARLARELAALFRNEARQQGRPARGGDRR